MHPVPSGMGEKIESEIRLPKPEVDNKPAHIKTKKSSQRASDKNSNENEEKSPIVKLKAPIKIKAEQTSGKSEQAEPFGAVKTTPA